MKYSSAISILFGDLCKHDTMVCNALLIIDTPQNICIKYIDG